MEWPDKHAVGFACAYTPLPLITAAGFTPYRVVPRADLPDRAGLLLHDNLCPHVKAILSRLLGGELKGLAGMVIMNSCDAMRRLHDAWTSVPGSPPAVLIDLPPTTDEGAEDFFAGELRRLGRTLSRWGSEAPCDRLWAEIGDFGRLAGLIRKLAERVRQGEVADGPELLLDLCRQACSSPFGRSAERLDKLLSGIKVQRQEGVPVFLFGNVLFERETFRLFSGCGLRVASSDLCTVLRLFPEITLTAGSDPYEALARALLRRTPCARTVDPASPLGLAEAVLVQAKGAKGVICHVAKFCDPYLGRLPAVRNLLREAGLPLLVLEGDCQGRNLGQQQTRIEAFAEMLRQGEKGDSGA